MITYRNLFSSQARSFIQQVNSSLLLPYCRADFDQNGALNINDLFAFLNAWFARSPQADFNQVNGVSIDDLFAYLNSWFTGCS